MCVSPQTLAMPETLPFALVIDDEKLIADTLTLVLNQHGFQAVSCTSIADALSILKTSQPDFLVSDVVLHEMGNGIDLAIAAKQLAPNCKAILMSGNAATADLLEQASQSGHMFTCLAKPLHPQELLAQMKTTAPDTPPQFPSA